MNHHTTHKKTTTHKQSKQTRTQNPTTNLSLLDPTLSHTHTHTTHSAPIAEAKYSLTAGQNGPVLMQDYVLTEKIANFARERTAPRNVHALGFGGFGKFTVTNDITRYCSAALFSQVGNTCETFTR